jgi:hypothetical protein
MRFLKSGHSRWPAHVANKLVEAVSFPKKLFFRQEATLAQSRDISSGEVTDPGWY